MVCSPSVRFHTWAPNKSILKCPLNILRAFPWRPERFEARLRQVETERPAPGGGARDTDRQQTEGALRRRCRSLRSHVTPHVSRSEKNHDTTRASIGRGSRLRESWKQGPGRNWL